MDTLVCKNKVLWSYDFEILQFTDAQKFARQVSGLPPLHNHRGIILLTKSSIIIEGDENLIVHLSAIKETYLGYGDIFKNIYVKNFGAFWKPLRIDFYGGTPHAERIDLIINHWGVFNSNNKWYELIKNTI